MDEPAIGERRLELATQLADVNVDGAVSQAQVAAPHGSVELLACRDRPEAPHHRHEQFELPYGQRQRAAVCEHEALVGPDLELTRVEDARQVRAPGGGCHDGEALQPRAPGTLQTCDLLVKNP